MIRKRLKILLSKEKNFFRHQFVGFRIFIPSNLQKKEKKELWNILALTWKKEFSKFSRAERKREKCDNYYQPQKRSEREKREKREAKVRNASVIGLCIFHAETFRRRSPKQKEEEMKRERDREREKQTRGKVRHGFGSRVVVVESSEPSQNRERAKKSCLAAITRPGAKGSNRKSTRSGVCHACGS